MIKADSPNLWEIRNRTDHATVVAILVTAMIHLSRLVNLPKECNLNRDQIGEIANDVVEEYGYLKPEEVKYIFKQAIRENKIFGRLDYAVVMKWIDDYDKSRLEYSIRISDQQETQQANQALTTPESMSFEEYVILVKQRAENGDMDAIECLANIEKMQQQPELLTIEGKHQKDVEFFKWKTLIYNKHKNV